MSKQELIKLKKDIKSQLEKMSIGSTHYLIINKDISDFVVHKYKDNRFAFAYYPGCLFMDLLDYDYGYTKHNIVNLVVSRIESV